MALRWRRGRAAPSAAGAAPDERARARSRRPVPLSWHGRLDPPHPDAVLVSVGVGPGGDAIALWAGARGAAALAARAVVPGGASFPASQPSRPVDAWLTRLGSDAADDVVLGGLPVAHPFVQPLPGARALVVGARCRWRPEGPERNAVVIGPDGAIEAEATFGDGISAVLATAAGAIWVGYFDEGVFGNYGWADPGPEPIGSCGILRWSADLRQGWRFPQDSVLGPVDDCYALNVDGEAAWACSYSEFSILRLEDDTVGGVLNDVAGARALVADGERAALVSGHGDRIVVGDLGATSFEPTSERRLVLDDGRELPVGAEAIGRGADLHVFVGSDWYRSDLPALAAPET